MTRRDAITTAVVMLAGTFDKALTKPALAGYVIALMPLTEDELHAATARALSECRFMPVPSELLALAGRARNLPAEIAEAWEAVRSAVHRLDYTESVDFGPRVNAVVRNLGGWLRLCELGKEALDVWARKEFERVYAALADKPPESLNGEAHMGHFRNAPTWVQIGNTPRPPRQIAGPSGGIRDLVRSLADEKAVG